MKEHRNLHAFICILFLILTVIPAGNCTRTRQKQEQQEKNDVEVPENIKENQDKFSMGMKKTTTSQQNETDKTLKLSEVKLPDIKTSYTIGTQKYLNLLPFFPESAIKPQDFYLGKLFEENESTYEVIALKKTIAEFMDSLVINKIDVALLAGGEDSGLYRLLDYHLKDSARIVKYRIGVTAIREDETGYSLVRLSGEKGGTNSEIYLIRVENKWLISDMQINFYELASGNEKAGEKFMPEMYKSIYEDM
jgi:hypothetical protein